MAWGSVHVHHKVMKPALKNLLVSREFARPRPEFRMSLGAGRGVFLQHNEKTWLQFARRLLMASYTWRDPADHVRPG